MLVCEGNDSVYRPVKRNWCSPRYVDVFIKYKWRSFVPVERWVTWIFLFVPARCHLHLPANDLEVTALRIFGGRLHIPFLYAYVALSFVDADIPHCAASTFCSANSTACFALRPKRFSPVTFS